jgi:ribosomal protein S17
MGEKHVLNIYFKTDDKGKLTGVCNMQCLSAAVYQKFVKKSHKICNKYVEFAPHPKRLDSISKPSCEELTRLDFNDVNTALANTVEAMENAPSNRLRNNDISDMVEVAVAKGTVIVRDEMQIMETRLTSQAKNFAIFAAEKAAKALKKEITTFKPFIILKSI